MPQYQIYFDTLEGEKRYDVDIDDDEIIDLVLRGILAELHERGHKIAGASTGDLKVVWGGREGRELDLSRTLPEQGVRPNDVLRVLVESYIAGARSLRADRIDKEWALLERLAGLNPETIEIVGRTPSAVEEVFHVRLRESPGVAAVRGGHLERRDEHSLRLIFTRFYPEMPIDCYVDERLFHPNVKPETGFVCLWEQARPRDTVIQALARAQAMAAYRLVNMNSVHVMNKDAGVWYETVAVPKRLVPLTWEELRVFEIRDGRAQWIDPARQVPRH
jgi:hypothetical protein